MSQFPSAALYRHFPSKDDLVVAYLESVDRRFKQWFERLASENADPADLLGAVFEGLAANLYGADFRGCHFINAAAEDSRTDSATRGTVRAHRAWFRGALLRLLQQAGFDHADAVASQLVAFRDGAMVGGYLESPEGAGRTLLKGFAVTVQNPALFDRLVPRLVLLRGLLRPAGTVCWQASVRLAARVAARDRLRSMDQACWAMAAMSRASSYSRGLRSCIPPSMSRPTVAPTEGFMTASQ